MKTTLNFVKAIFWSSGEKRLRAGWRILAHLLVLLLLFMLSSFNLMPSGLPQNRLVDFILKVIGENLSWMIIVLSLLIAGKFLDRRPFKSYGFALDRAWWLDMGFGLALGALLMAVIFGVEYALGWVTVTPTLEPSQPLFWEDIFFYLLLFISVGIQEEVMSRGYWLRNIAEGLNFRRIGPRAALWISYAISSSIFGLLHFANPNSSWVSTVNLILAGLFLGLPYLLTGELAISIGLHITWNFFQGNVFGFPVSGMRTGTTLITIQQSGPQLWTGGAFGPEAGLIGIAAIVIGSLLILLWVKSTRQRLAWQDSLAIYPVARPAELPVEQQA
jgi:uncharacterized protein